jgi:YHS domain-containing protein
MAETTAREFKTVCGGSVKDPSQYPSTEYRGKQIYFCTQACLRVFELDPERSCLVIEHFHDEE